MRYTRTIIRSMLAGVLLTVPSIAQIDPGANENTPGIKTPCFGTGMLVGIRFKGHPDIAFSTERNEENGWNEIILNSVEKVIKEKFTLIYDSEVAKYADCQCRLAVVRLDYYKETYVEDGENKGDIGMTVSVYDSPKSQTPYKTYTLRGEGDSDYGHSDPLEYSIVAACRAFESQELGFNRLRVGFGPFMGLNFVEDRYLLSPNFAFGATYGKHFVSVMFSAGLTLENSDTAYSGDTRIVSSSLFLGAGLNYAYAVYQNKLVSLGPSLAVGGWMEREQRVHAVRNGSYVYTEGASGPGIYDEVKTDWIKNWYLCAPGIDIRGRVRDMQLSLEGKAYLGIRVPAMYVVRLGVMFMRG